jgi:homoserine O-acetyltransferase
MRLFCSLLLATLAVAQTPPPNYPPPAESDYTVRNFRFKTGEQLDVRLHYRSLGQPQRDARGHVTNAVIILHGTGGSGAQFLRPYFANQLFGPGQLLDVTNFFVILPDDVGHGKSSKPSDGLRMRFPHYDYDDMVALEHALVADGLHVDHLRLVMGTSMGCMHTWLWLEQWPDMMDAGMPLACLPVEIAGRNRYWRKLLMDAIRRDPAWNNGDYKEQPREGLLAAQSIQAIAGAAPLRMRQEAPTRDQSDALAERAEQLPADLDANDKLYQFDASRTYNPQPRLGAIKAPVIAINSADDFINPPELGILEREIKNVPRGSAVVLPASVETHGHGTHTYAMFWQRYLAQLLRESTPARTP